MLLILVLFSLAFFYQFLGFPCQGNFGKIPKVTLIWKTQKLVFHVPCFVDEHVTVGHFNEEEGESLHHKINLGAAQWSCVRNDTERL